jgi:hypothetical protein
MLAGRCAAILAKLRPEPVREPLPPPKVYAPPRFTRGRRRRGLSAPGGWRTTSQAAGRTALMENAYIICVSHAMQEAGRLWLPALGAVSRSARLDD